jgi:hypothetical protein
MLLRKVIRHVREQSWTAITIDFLIVVLGVFVGIQVNNWNLDRLDAQRAHGYLLRIQSDIESDLKAIERREAYWKWVVDYGQAAISYAEEGELRQGSRWPSTTSPVPDLRFWITASGSPLRSREP